MKKDRLIPKRRFKEFKNDEAWEQRKLGDLADIVRGASPRPIQDSKWFNENSDVGWLRIADVTEQDGRIYHLEQHISELGQEKTRVLTESHLLLSIAATVGKPVVNYVKTGVHDGFLIFLNPKFDREFMFQWLEMFRSMWQKYGQPGSQVNLNSDLVKNQEILLPSYKEQIKIGQFFNDLDNLITLHQRKLKKLKYLKLAYLSEMFPEEGEKYPKRRFAGFTAPWEQRKLSEVAVKIGDGLHGTPQYSKEGNIYFINGNNLVDGKIIITNDTKIVTEKEQSFDDMELDSNNTILMSINGTIGNLALYNGERLMLGKSASYITVKNINREFLFYTLQTNSVRNYFFDNLTGTTIKNLGLKTIRDTNIFVPNEQEQHKIVSILSNLDNLITFHQCKLEKLENIKKAYLNEMFV